MRGLKSKPIFAYKQQWDWNPWQLNPELSWSHPGPSLIWTRCSVLRKKDETNEQPSIDRWRHEGNLKVVAAISARVSREATAFVSVSGGLLCWANRILFLVPKRRSFLKTDSKNGIFVFPWHRSLAIKWFLEEKKTQPPLQVGFEPVTTWLQGLCWTTAAQHQA